jgi:hypothetical protein
MGLRATDVILRANKSGSVANDRHSLVGCVARDLEWCMWLMGESKAVKRVVKSTIVNR